MGAGQGISCVQRSPSETNDSFFPTEEVAKSPFASLVGVVIGQKIRFMKARALRAQVYQHFGTTFSPSAVLDDLEILEDILGPEHRQQYDAISRLCIKAEDCKINPRTAREIQDLCAGIRGIGPWTIAAVLAARLLDWNILPKKDKFLERKLRELPPADFPKDPTTQWAPYCTIATWYLWRWRIQ